MGIEVSDLPDWAARQVLSKLGEKPKQSIPKKNKMHNVKTEIGGVTFDSKREARRYEELMLLLRAGEISDLRLQVNFTLQEGFTTPEGERVRPMVYKADFTYWQNGKYVVEDSKGQRTRVYLDKKKRMLDKFGIKIQEV